MFFSLDTTVGVWLMAVPDYEWRPVPPATADPPRLDALVDTTVGRPVSAPIIEIPAIPGPPPSDPCELPGVIDASQLGSPGDGLLPQMELVMTGLRWVVVPMWSQYENPVRELAQRIGNDDANQRYEHYESDQRISALLRAQQAAQLHDRQLADSAAEHAADNANHRANHGATNVANSAATGNAAHAGDIAG